MSKFVGNTEWKEGRGEELQVLRTNEARRKERHALDVR